MTNAPRALTGGELLALGDEHRRGLHRTAVADCTRCFLAGLDRPWDVGGAAADPITDAATVEGEADESEQHGS